MRIFYGVRVKHNGKVILTKGVWEGIAGKARAESVKDNLTKRYPNDSVELYEDKIYKD